MAQKLKFGNGTWATKEGSTLAYNDENEKYKPLPFSFERDSIGTRVNKEGLIEIVGKDIPRIDYTDSTEGVLLLENSSTNLITYSEDFSQGVWNKTNCTIISNNSISPNGTQNADKLVENNIINGFSNRYSTSVSYTSGAKYTTSIFAKSDGRDLMIRSYNGSSDIDTIFDLSNGIVLLGNGEIKDYGNGWYRCSHTITAQSTINTSFSASFVLVNNSSISYQGDGTSGIYIWGAMVEQGSYPTSYIPTNGSTVQRAAETCNESGNSEVFNDSQGVLFVDSATLVEGEDVRIIGLSDGGTNNRISITYHSTENRIQIYGSKNGTIFNLEYLNAIKTDYNKIAIKYNASSVDFYYNGFLVDTEVPSDMFDANILNSLNFDRIDNNNNFYGKTKEIGYYDEILTDAELETLTSYRSLSELVTELNLNTL